MESSVEEGRALPGLSAGFTGLSDGSATYGREAVQAAYKETVNYYNVTAKGGVQPVPSGNVVTQRAFAPATATVETVNAGERSCRSSRDSDVVMQDAQGVEYRFRPGEPFCAASHRTRATLAVA